jgi:hypothetical protein
MGMRHVLLFIFAVLIVQSACATFAEGRVECPQVIASTYRSELTPNDKILISPFSEKLFRITKIGRALRRHLKIKNSLPPTDQFLDFTLELRERHTVLSRYTRWLRDVQRMAEERQIRSDHLLAILADSYFRKNPNRFFSVPLTAAEEPDSNVQPTKAPSEFEKDLHTCRSMAGNARLKFKKALTETVDGKVRSDYLGAALQQQRMAIRAALITAKESFPDEQMIARLQQFILMELHYQLPSDMQVHLIKEKSSLDRLTFELDKRPAVLGATLTFVDALRFPDSPEFWTDLIAMVSVDQEKNSSRK